MAKSSGRVTEILHLPIKKVIDIDVGMSSMATVLQGVAGVINQYWGIQIEHNDMVDIIVGWKSLAHYKEMAPNTINEVLSILAPLIDANRPVNVCHIPNSPSTETVLSAPIVEVLFFTIIPNNATLEVVLQPFFTEVSKSEAQSGIVDGWKVKEEGGNKFVALQGWRSVDAHFETTSTGRVKEELDKVQPFIGEAESHHVTFKNYVA